MYWWCNPWPMHGIRCYLLMHPSIVLTVGLGASSLGLQCWVISVPTNLNTYRTEYIYRMSHIPNKHTQCHACDHTDNKITIAYYCTGQPSLENGYSQWLCWSDSLCSCDKLGPLWMGSSGYALGVCVNCLYLRIYIYIYMCVSYIYCACSEYVCWVSWSGFQWVLCAYCQHLYNYTHRFV